MSFSKRLERNIIKLEHNIEKEHTNIKELKHKLEQHKITKATYNVKRNHIEEKIRSMDSRMRTLQGGLVKEKRHLEEKAHEKQNKHTPKSN